MNIVSSSHHAPPRKPSTSLRIEQDPENLSHSLVEPLVQELSLLLKDSGLNSALAIRNGERAIGRYRARVSDSYEEFSQEALQLAVLRGVLDGFVPTPEKEGELAGGYEEIRSFFEGKALWAPIERVARGKTTFAELQKPTSGMRAGELTMGMQMYANVLAVRYKYVDLEAPVAKPEAEDGQKGDSLPSSTILDHEETSVKKEPPSEEVIDSEESELAVEQPIPAAITRITSVPQLGTALIHLRTLKARSALTNKEVLSSLSSSMDTTAASLRSLGNLAGKLSSWMRKMAEGELKPNIREVLEMGALLLFNQPEQDAQNQIVNKRKKLLCQVICEFGKDAGLGDFVVARITGSSGENQNITEKVRALKLQLQDELEDLSSALEKVRSSQVKVQDSATHNFISTAEAILEFIGSKTTDFFEKAFDSMEQAQLSLTNVLDRLLLPSQPSVEPDPSNELAEQYPVDPPTHMPRDPLEALADLVASADELEEVQLDDDEIDQEDDEDEPLVPPEPQSLGTPSGVTDSASFVELYDAMMNARVRKDGMAIPPWTELSFKGGLQVSGYMLFNEFRGTGRLINPDQEVSIDFDIGQVTEVKWWD